MNHSITHIESKPKTTTKSSSFFKPTIQKKLNVGSANDSYELEADNIANKVMRMSEASQQNVSHTGALVQRKCTGCEEEKIHKKSLAENITPLIQCASNSESGGQAPKHVESQINSSRGGGSVMDHKTKNFMEGRFGTDFSDVKIHTGSEAVQMSRELNAQAFTVGNDIYFNEGKYSPNSDSGKHLLAHELTHTIQQQFELQRKIIQRQLQCPSSLASNEETPSGFKSYFGNSCTFHCCFRGIIEDRTPSVNEPQNECFYDDFGNLVDENHVYSNCRGTPNDYDSSTSWWDHTFNDRGGIWNKGRVAYNESNRFSDDREIVMSIGTISRTQPEPHLGRRSRIVKTGAIWVSIGKQEILIVVQELEGGSGRLLFLSWVNGYFRNLAESRAIQIQGSIPTVQSNVITGLPSRIPSSAVIR
jgi:hypothetical protein